MGELVTPVSRLVVRAARPVAVTLYRAWRATEPHGVSADPVTIVAAS